MAVSDKIRLQISLRPSHIVFIGAFRPRLLFHYAFEYLSKKSSLAHSTAQVHPGLGFGHRGDPHTLETIKNFQ